ncbi:MAG: malate/lactate/ureidoglycolate dehydrogenase [Pirellulales bacterium]|nr:malate/lactate/ureidoglycolate dehydrogenase [Pirellulales bacterium]
MTSLALHVEHATLRRFVSQIFRAAGCRPPEDERVARYLVESNLVGHDSHGVIRVPTYVRFLREGKVVANVQPRVVLEGECLAIIDGQYGFGQTVGEAAMDLGLARCARHGVAVVGVRNCGHLGRIGDWPQRCCEAGMFSLHFVNTSGLGILVAPHGGIDRRLSANPIAAGVPMPDGKHIILDISTSAIAEGKIRVAYNKGVHVPEGCLIDAEGRPTSDPQVFYGTPPGAILPFGGHKGYGLGIIAELLAGALAGGGCSRPGVERLSNGWLAVILDPRRFGDVQAMAAEMQRFVEYVKSSRRAHPQAEILMPGELEERTKAARLSQGIPLDETTWRQIVETAESLGVNAPPLA